MAKYDFVIIGSGLGGLECAVILSKEGYNVCVVEKNPICGGCFQSFSRRRHVMDTGIHYIGSMDDGQILHQYFKYFGVLNSLKMRRLDGNAFDTILIDGKEYRLAMGFDRYAESLSEYFPHESASIHCYTKQLERIYSLISTENLKKGIISAGGMDYFSMSASKMIEDSFKDENVRDILAGNSILYGGIYDYSTLYHHGMVNASNIAGSYRFVDGSQHVADAFVDVIKANGGTVKTKSEVTRIVVENHRVAAVEINNGKERIEADNFISNIHPSVTLKLLDKTPIIKKAYYSRLSTLPNSYGIFTVYLVMKKSSFPYLNSNIYIHSGKDVWFKKLTSNNKMEFALISCQANSRDEIYTDVVTLLVPMSYSEVEPWKDTVVGKRGASYEEFKAKKAHKIIEFCSEYYPTLKQNIESIYTTSPLSYRDYIGTPEGSAYGIMKDYRNPMVTLIPTRTKLSNLLLTGQNLNVHGALGVTLTAMLTCSEFLGKEYLANKVGSV